jgi:hypothetical protein
MTIPTKELTRWIALYKHGDYMDIASDYIYLYQRIDQNRARKWVMDAFKTGECKESVYTVIVAYYKKIEKQLKKPTL